MNEAQRNTFPYHIANNSSSKFKIFNLNYFSSDRERLPKILATYLFSSYSSNIAHLPRTEIPVCRKNATTGAREWHKDAPPVFPNSPCRRLRVRGRIGGDGELNCFDQGKFENSASHWTSAKNEAVFFTDMAEWVCIVGGKPFRGLEQLIKFILEEFNILFSDQLPLK